MPVSAHTKNLRSAILDCICYHAVFDIRLTTLQVFNMLHIKATYVSVQNEITKLRGKKVLTGYKDGSFGVSGHNYPPHQKRLVQQQAYLHKARRLGKVMRLVPWVKAVVVINSVAYGNCSQESDIDLLFVTTPHRLYIAKGLVYYTLNLLRQRESKTDKAGKFSTGWWLTSNGVRFERDLMPTAELQLPYWLVTAKPVYGAKVWQQLLAESSYLRSQFPNYPFKHHQLPIHLLHLEALNRLDSRGFKLHLRHVALQQQYKSPNSFLRIRPDLIVQNSDAKLQLKKIIDSYKKIRASV